MIALAGYLAFERIRQRLITVVCVGCARLWVVEFREVVRQEHQVVVVGILAVIRKLRINVISRVVRITRRLLPAGRGASRYPTHPARIHG